MLIGGIFSYINLPRSYDPGFILRVARVVTYFPGASPERVEQLVTDKLEKVIMEIPELDYVVSSSMSGVSIIDVWIKEEYKNLRPVWDKLERKVEKAGRAFPDSIRKPVVNDEYGDVFGVMIAVTGDDFSYRELREIAEDVKDEVLLLDNAAKVELYGEQEERIFVSYSNARLSQLGLTPYFLLKVLESRNIILPGGSIDIGRERVIIEPTGNFSDIEELKKTVIHIYERNETVFLEDIADISRGYITPPRNLMRADGKKSVGVAISLKDGGNIIDLGKSVKKLLKNIENEFPYGISFHLVNFSPGEVESKVLLFQENLIQSVAIVLASTLVMLGLKTGFVVASLIPMAILMTFLEMFFFKIGIDQMSLASLVISLGILVDNAIVITESAQVEINMGKKPFEAVMGSSKELSFSLLTSSATTAAAFLPIYLAESETGEYTAPLFKVVSLALFSSWLLSLTMIPLLCVFFIRKKKDIKKPRFRTFIIIFRKLYRKSLFISLRYKYIFILLVLIIFFFSIKLFTRLPVIFFPPSDRLIFKVEMKLSPGTTIETTENIVKKTEKYIVDNFMGKKKSGKFLKGKFFGSNYSGNDVSGGVISMVSHIGNGGSRFLINHKPEFGMPHYALMVINVTHLSIIPVLEKKLEDFILSSFPDVDLKITKIQNGPPVTDPVQIRISGKDIDELFKIVNKVKSRLGSMEGTRNISDDWGRRTKKLVIKVDYPNARRAGVSSRDIALSLYTAIKGFKMTDFREGDKLIPVLLKSKGMDKNSVEKLESLAVYSSLTGKNVSLGQVADVEIVWEASEIKRRDRKKTVTISSALTENFTAKDIISKIDPWLKQESAGWGLGYKYSFGGEVEESAEANEAIMEKVPLCGFIILMLLIFQFNSLRKTFIIISTIPMAVIGVVAGLYATRLYFGFMTLLGIVSLAGIVINNAIVLLERIKVEIMEGNDSGISLIYACERRMRPILLTTITTIMGVLPLYFGGGAIWKPMVVSIIAGLGFSTLLTLGVVPMLYCACFGIKFKGDELEKMRDIESEFKI